MNRNEKIFLKWLIIVLASLAVVYFIVKVIDAIIHPSIVWFIIGSLSALVVEGIAWCIYRWRMKTWRFWI
jgi:hypothetical protein